MDSPKDPKGPGEGVCEVGAFRLRGVRIPPQRTGSAAASKSRCPWGHTGLLCQVGMTLQALRM